MAEKVAWRKSHVISTGFVSTILVEESVACLKANPTWFIVMFLLKLPLLDLFGVISHFKAHHDIVL